ncbi:hypothetical protein [Desulfovibrio intestinalis]|uniref:Uncharacterized protein n=1 Tax=Desulfovibrio intestinalis TaxID=58621 RepID=A0A7W8C4P5_9BACT|nr:hypothetical protein [Desulfovibrio intestinalis]MBB5144269.1 hypothetical protein [Desulfovibrio intestinalis]
MTAANTYCLWNSNTTEAFANAMRQRVSVRIRSCLLHEGNLADMVFHGKFRSVEGREVQFIVRHKEVIPGKSKALENTCEFFFCLEEESSSGKVRMGYQGPGIVLEVGQNEKNELRNLRLRLAKDCSVRQMRRDKRVPWSTDRSRLAGVVPLEDVPATRTDLRALLAQYYNSSHPNPLPLVNISAGGVCACIPEELAKLSLTSNFSYLFFIVPNKAPASAQPYIFLSKKMGLCRNLCDEGTALRLLFTEELNWDSPGPNLKWNDILASGSSRLRTCLEEYYDNEDEISLTA